DLALYTKAYLEEVEKATAQVSNEHDEVVAAGGLYVLGTERHESRRIDNQLRGRSGRQGDPGASRFYLSLQDDLMRRFNADLVDAFLRRFNVPDDQPIEAKMVTNAIKNAQTQVEQQNFEIRKNVLKYDEVLNLQRQVVYAERNKILEGQDLSEQVQLFITETLQDYVSAATGEGFEEEWDLDALWRAFKTLYPISITHEKIRSDLGGTIDQASIIEAVVADALAAYRVRETTLSPAVMRELERQVMLAVLDKKWREHLYEMDYLQEGIGLRAMGQRDPLVEYQREGYDLFVAMMDSIKEQVVGLVFNAQVNLSDPTIPKPKEDNLQYSAPSLDTKGSTGPKSTPVARGETVGRNEPCPCGSGKKYKKCHGLKV
ncbi:MAG: SEC-C metal-binding domain-containing protein, partial [Candidatus Nanopelagicales bacterium]